MTVRDDGRGIPTDIHAEEGVSAAEVVLTRLHAGGKFNQNSYKVSGGLHGVGAAVVNALSEWMEVRIWRHGEEHFIRFRDGDAEAPLAVDRRRAASRSGTEVTFKPSPATFTKTEFDYARAGAPAARAGVPQLGPDDRAARRAARAGARRPSCATTAGWSPSSSGWTAPRPRCCRRRSACARAADQQGIRVEFALTWNDSFHETMLCFTNNIPQRDGGTHLAGFRQALTRVVTQIRRGHGQEGNLCRWSATTCARA